MESISRCLCMMLAVASTAGPVAVAAPIPGTSSSLLINKDKGLFRSPLGFSLHRADTQWIHSAPPAGVPSIATVYRAPESHSGVQPALTVRVDRLRSPLTLKHYAKRWMKDYHRFGFDVLAAKPVRLNDEIAFLVDILNRETDKQLRQVVFLKDQTAVVLTCRDHRKGFENTLRSCNQIIRTFRWNSESAAK